MFDNVRKVKIFFKDERVLRKSKNYTEQICVCVELKFFHSSSLYLQKLQKSHSCLARPDVEFNFNSNFRKED